MAIAFEFRFTVKYFDTSPYPLPLIQQVQILVTPRVNLSYIEPLELVGKDPQLNVATLSRHS